MAEYLNVKQGTKEEMYKSLIPQIISLIKGEDDLIANLGNIVAALKGQFNWFWIGFYLVKKDVLVLGPFQGPIACTRIRLGKGVCGTSWEKGKTVIVPDVQKFEGHIACSIEAKSEIVVPIFKNNEVIGVLDIDSEFLNQFDHTDQFFLEKIVTLIAFE